MEPFGSDWLFSQPIFRVKAQYFPLRVRKVVSLECSKGQHGGLRGLPTPKNSQNAYKTRVLVHLQIACRVSVCVFVFGCLQQITQPTYPVLKDKVRANDKKRGLAADPLTTMGDKKDHKQLSRIVPRTGGLKIVYVLPFSSGERKHKQNPPKISGKCRDSPGTILG